MSKAPAFQFYPGDWIQDTRPISLAAKGAWIDLLCAMWRSQNRGTLTMSLVGYGRLIGADVEQTQRVIKELTDMQICDYVTDGNGNVTLTNRRMVRDEKERITTRLRVQRFRNADEKRPCNANVTVPSSSSSSSSSSKDIKETYGENRVSPCPHQDIISLYHEVLPELPPVKMWTPQRQAILRARWGEDPERQCLEWWREYFAKIRASPFLMGQEKEFRADLEWIIRPKNMPKIIEGRYNKRNSDRHQGIKEWLEHGDDKTGQAEIRGDNGSAF